MDYEEYDENEQLTEAKKETILHCLNDREYIPVKRNELFFLMQVPTKDRHIFDDIINLLIKDGQIIETKKGKLMTPKLLNMHTGIFCANSKGFGFVTSDIAGERDIFIPADYTCGAMHKDKVLYRIVQKDGRGTRNEGEIIKIIERGIENIVGTFEKGNGFGFVMPDNKKIASDIFIPRENAMGAVTGHKVVVKITKRPEGRRNPEGKITEILGHIDDPGVDILSIIREYNLVIDFPEDVKNQIAGIPDEISSDDINERDDYRNLQTVTIDGEDAKDLDDAISIELLENGNFSLGVHIADVSNYVTEDSPLDKEAYARGTSVYLVDRVIPMIPHKLSNGICSLNPNTDRLTLSCVMEIDRNGTVLKHKISKSVIHSDRRMTYTAVNSILTENDTALLEEYKDFVNMFKNMETLCKILQRKREKRGSVNFDLPESKIILDENGVPLEIRPYERNIATKIIEEFMLICNETVAEDFFWQESPFIYRTHEAPDEEKISKMKDVLGSFGYRIKGITDIHSKDIQQIVKLAEGKPEEHIINRIILRSMKQARYMAENYGHFGLAAKYYCHFTSPIRRYPDLQIHRIIKESLYGGLSDKRRRKLEKYMPDVAKQCSIRERVADEAERDTDQLKKVQFMLDKVGNVYDGIISGVTSWGIYVELSNTVEGMVAVSELDDDYYIFDEEHLKYIGEHKKKTYRLGDNVRVQVTRASMELKVIDFIFSEE